MFCLQKKGNVKLNFEKERFNLQNMRRKINKKEEKIKLFVQYEKLTIFTILILPCCNRFLKDLMSLEQVFSGIYFLSSMATRSNSQSFFGGRRFIRTFKSFQKDSSQDSLKAMAELSFSFSEATQSLI